MEEKELIILDLENHISALERKKEELTSENDRMTEEAKGFQHKYFELQAKLIDAEVEIAKAKNQYVGPALRKR